MLRSQLLLLQLLQAQIGSAPAAVQSTSPGGCALTAFFTYFLPHMPPLLFFWSGSAMQSRMMYLSHSSNAGVHG